MRNVHFVFRLCGLMGETNAQDEPPREHTNDFGLPDHENLLGWGGLRGRVRITKLSSGHQKGEGLWLISLTILG